MMKEKLSNQETGLAILFRPLTWIVNDTGLRVCKPPHLPRLLFAELDGILGKAEPLNVAGQSATCLIAWSDERRSRAAWRFHSN